MLIAILIVLIILNAFFSMSEMATVSANRNEIKSLAEDGNKRAVKLLRFWEKPNHFLSTIQVSITLAGFLQSAIAATYMSGGLGRWITGLGIPYGVQIAVVIITLILSYINLVFGELIPKRIGIQYPEKIALATSGVVGVFSKIAAPFVWLLSKSVSVCLLIFGIKLDSLPEKYSEEEIKSHLDVGIEAGEIDEAGADMIASVFEFDDKLAKEIMTPRTDIFMVNINDAFNDHLDEILKRRFMRIPFFDQDQDDVVGVLYMKDYYIHAKKSGWNRVAVKKLLRKPFFIPEARNIDELFRDMRDRREHIAFLVDEYGGLSGMVTTEDIIEEVMGAIDDEYDDTEPKIEQRGPYSFEVDGNYYLDDLNEMFEDIGLEGVKLESDDYETIGGLVMDMLGEIPADDAEQQTVDFYRCKVRVLSWKERRIEKVLLEIQAEIPDEDKINIDDERNSDHDS